MRQLALLVNLFTLTSIAAQNDFDLDKTTAGTLGDTLTLEVANAGANRLFGVMMSYSGGPTAIAPFDPADPRSVAVGLDLTTNWYLLSTDASGSRTIDTALPNDPVFQGEVLHWQCATVPGTATILDEISNPIRTHLGQAGTGSALPGALLGPRAADFACDLGDGDTLLVGVASSERFRFRTLDTEDGPTLNIPGGGPAATRLNDGRYLFTGGIDGTGAALADCEIYDPATDTFTTVASMGQIRAGHAAATMSDGRVLVAGGSVNFADLQIAITGVLNTAEIYNPATNSWSAAPNIGGRRLVPALTQLGNGNMLLSGGVEVTLFFGIPLNVVSTIKTQLYNPTSNSWSNAANMPSGRAFHHPNQLTLTDGRVLLSGGVLVPSLLGAANSTAVANADLYDPTTNSWTATNMSQSRTTHSVTELANGDVVVCGGAGGLLSAATQLDSVESFDPASNTWTTVAPLSTPRAAHTALLLPDGLLVLLGGSGSTDGEALHD